MEDFARYIGDNNAFLELPYEKLFTLVNRALTVQRKGYQRRSKYEVYAGDSEAILDMYRIAREAFPATVFLLMKCVYVHEARRCGAEISGDQTPRHLFHVERLSREYPGARFLHMVRDPRAVMLSQKNKWKAARLNHEPLSEVVRVWLNYHPISMALLWKRVVQEGSRLSSLLSNDVIKCVKFEELCDDPESIVRSCCDFCQVDFQMEMLQVGGAVSSNLGKKTYGGINKGVVDVWRRKLSKTEIFFVELITGKEMRGFGYRVTGIKPNPFALLAYVIYFPVHVTISLAANLGRMGNSLEYLARRLIPWGRRQ